MLKTQTFSCSMLFSVVVLALAACDNDTASSTSSSNLPKSRYDLANGCYALQSADDGRFVTRTESGFAEGGADAGAATPFYLKPTALGEYLLFAKDASLLSANGAGVAAQPDATDSSNWVINTDATGYFSLASATNTFLKPVNGNLTLSDTAGKFRFVPTSGCTPYPEMPVDISGVTYKGQGINKPVIGFADGHTHMMMTHEMSDGSGHVGPSAGGVLYGQMFNRFGVAHALDNCDALHGPNGIFDPDTVIHTSPSPHETQGWPTFIGWPTHISNTHQVMYYKWVERAFVAGLRLQVNLGTNINALCEMGRTFGSAHNPALLTADCNDMNLGIGQLKYMHQMQDYVDAQEGGPGKGWYRIVKSPTEARQVINDGKLAVVPGVEFADLFDCTVTFLPGGQEISGCTKEQIDEKLNELYALGVRQIYPFHDVNSALGGTGIFSGMVMNMIGFVQTQAFWKTYPCPDSGEGDRYFYNAGAEIETGIPGTGNDPLTQAVFAQTGGTLPVYPPGRQCNARGLTELGRYAVEQIMKKKIVIDIDHAELSIKQEIIDIAKAQNPPYPLISMHGGHGGISTQQAKDILALGGIIYPYAPNGKGYEEFVQKLKPIWPSNRPLAIGFGFDGNGFGGYAGPRGADSTPIKYPVTLFQGPGWGPQFAAAGIKPVVLNQLTIPESGKTWNPDEVGNAHYGLMADFVEQVRIEGGQEAVDALFNSAEAYLQMWEKVDNR